MTTRRLLFAANWKMHKTPDEAREFAAELLPQSARLSKQASIAILAPFIDIPCVLDAFAGSGVGVGAQDCYWEPQGAFTGEVSAAMLGALRLDYCVVGHSERRRLFGETDETVALKVSALLEARITPIVCVGETLEQRQAGRTHEVVMRQISEGLGHLSDEQRAALVVAYEPVWAIGTGVSDDPKNADATIAMLRSCAGGLAEGRVLYGGSMNEANARALCAQSNVDGGLIGSASLDAASFAGLIRNGLAGAGERAANVRTP